MKFTGCIQISRPALLVTLAVLVAVPGSTQTVQANAKTGDNASVNASLGELQSQVRELKEMVLQLQQQTMAGRAEISHLREELEAQRRVSGTAPGAEAALDEASPAIPASSAAQLQHRADQVAEDEQLLSDKLNEQYQTKLESASKYRVRFSGVVLFNLFGNSGYTDNQDVPSWVLSPDPMDSRGSVGATLRQSILGFEVFGPDVFGAHSSGNVNLDFGGGFPANWNGVNSGIVRLRTAAVRLDWKDTSVIAGQDALFLSGQGPTSFASLIVPPLTYSGNLWSWTPQLRIEHRFEFSNHSKMTLQAAVLDPLTGETPNDFNYVWFRTPDAGEESRQPAYAARVAYSHPFLARTLTVGAGGYYSREYWGFKRNVNGYAATTDVNLPLNRWFTLSGFLYRGQAIGGLGAAFSRSVVYNGPLSDPATSVLPLNSVGGWGQLKFQPLAKLEFNAALGQDNPFAADIRYFGGQAESYANPFLTRNRAGFGNVIYRPRSDLVLSMEYRRLRTFSIYDSSWRAGQLNMAMGILF